MQAGTLPPRLAAAFWLGLERGASFIFAADPPGAGKTTILTALLVFAPPDMLAYFTRGWGETFDLPPPSEDYPTYLMVNEMSDHLPVYSWGPYVARVFELLGEGYSLCTTMHADDVEGVIDQLRNDAGVPPEHLARLTFVVPLDISRSNEGTRRRVSNVGVFSAGPDGYSVRSIASWDRHRDEFSVLASVEQTDALATRLGLESNHLERELSRRERFLDHLVTERISEIPAVEKAVEAFRTHRT
jgi:hypothetical protein